MPLLQLVYISTATQLHGEADLKKIMDSAWAKNEANGLTGMLIYCEGNFMQVLEGESDAVQATYLRISKDLRHKEIIEVLRQPIEQRSFDQWGMGFRTIDLAELLLWPAYVPFFDGRFSMADFGAKPGMVLEMLKNFALNDRAIRLS